MVSVEPKERIADQKAADFMAAVIENITVPLGLHSLARVGMLEHMGAVEISRGRARQRENATAPNRG